MAHAQEVHVGGGVAIAHLLPLQQKSISGPVSRRSKQSAFRSSDLSESGENQFAQEDKVQLAALYLTS